MQTKCPVKTVFFFICYQMKLLDVKHIFYLYETYETILDAISLLLTLGLIKNNFVRTYYDLSINLFYFDKNQLIIIYILLTFFGQHSTSNSIHDFAGVILKRLKLPSMFFGVLM